jgi:GcrA cell cycle regulator
MGVMRSNTWTEADKQEAARMWKAGKAATRIAVAFDVSEESIRNLSRRNRSMFPHRQQHTRTHAPRESVKHERPVEVTAESEPTLYADRVTRRTVSGAKVTMPRVSFIDGPYREAAE